MLKDYFDSAISPERLKVVHNLLDRVPRWQIFDSYGQARSYRALNDFKREDTGYDYSIFLYDGFYYVIPKEYRRTIINEIAFARRSDDFDDFYARFDKLYSMNLHSYFISNPADRLIPVK
jgi:hypothetical protein